KLRFRSVENFETTRIQVLESRFTLDDVQRRAFLRSRFSKRQTAAAKLKHSHAPAFRSFPALVVPVQPAGNHQVQHEPQISFEPDADPFPKPAQFDDSFAFNAGQRRHGRAQQKRTGDTDAFEYAAA